MEPMTDKYMTVATWNILYRDRESRLRQVIERLQRVGPDVLLLQETDLQHAQQVAQETGMMLAAIAPPNGDGIQSLPAVLTRTQPVTAGAVRFENIQGEERHYVFAEIVCFGRQLRCGTAHLHSTDRAGRLGVDPDYRRVSQRRAGLDSLGDSDLSSSVSHRLEEINAIREIREGLTSIPEIFGGDLNFVPRGIEYQAIQDWGLRDAWSDGPRLGSGATILGNNPLVADGPRAYAQEIADHLPGHLGEIDFTLDFQFCSVSFETRNAWTFGNGRELEGWASDHLGLAVEYALADG